MKSTSFLIYTGFAVCAAFTVAAVTVIIGNDAASFYTSTMYDKAGASGSLSQNAGGVKIGLQSSAFAAESAPDHLSANEKQYREHLTQVIKPLIELKLSKGDKAALQSALKALKNGDLDRALKEREKISIAAGKTFIRWATLRSGYGRPEDYRNFLEQNPLWPDRSLLQRRLEQSLFIDGGSARNILAQFKNAPPQTDAGHAAIASAHLALGNRTEAKRYAAKAWCGGGIAASREQSFLKRFDGLLTHDDHTCRLNRLLVSNLRWRSSRKRRAHAIRRVIKLLDKKDQKKATARLSAFLRQDIATKWMNAVPAKQRKGDYGYAFQRIQHLRIKDKDSQAWKLLAQVPSASDKLINLDAWWEERHANALNAIKEGKHKLAANFVNGIRPEGVNAAKDQAFFAGWLALRKRQQSQAAAGHFKRFLALVDGPLSTSKAHYWLGRAYTKLGDKGQAEYHYKAGAKYLDTFHGLLSAQTLSSQNQTLDLPLPVTPTDKDVADFLNSEAVQAALIARALDRPRRQILNFFRSLAKGLPNEAQVAMLGQLAAVLGDGQLEVRTGKAGISRGFNMYIFSYPLTYLPDYEPLRPPPEQALIFAVARQESEFNTGIVSGAGARGILQVMPITARDVCRRYKIKCNISKLLKEPSYNARLATAYIADRTDEFNGSYILTFTGYNAGPGRTRQWLRQLGDPRSQQLEPLDWIYRIPFEETRIYAQKVLSNVQVYRARLGIKKPLRILNDMQRGSSKD